MTRRRSWIAQSARRSGGGPHAPSRAKREAGRDWRTSWEAEREEHEDRLRECSLQPTPVRTEEGRALQRAFAATEPLVEANYADLELRIAEHLGEPFCACGRRWSDCDGSRARCHKKV
ncbi:MAG: hypothetical protein ACRCSL_16605 [Microbacterium sp.]